MVVNANIVLVFRQVYWLCAICNIKKKKKKDQPADTAEKERKNDEETRERENKQGEEPNCQIQVEILLTLRAPANT